MIKFKIKFYFAEFNSQLKLLLKFVCAEKVLHTAYDFNRVRL